MTRDLTKGPILGGILRLFGPLLASKLLQQCYNVADGVIVGRLLGVSAFSAVGCTGAVNFMVLGFAIGSCSGFSIPIAQSFGAKNGEEVKKNAAQLIWLGLLLTAFLMLLALLFTDDVLRLMRTPPEIFDEAYRYIIVILMGTGATILYNLTSFVLRALGDTRTPLFFLTASVTLNIVLDVLFIRFLSLGVSGAAIATV
ncbi:MAG: polysaccharide biosynthesis C-terminal domain-containing protein, partial [Oscillibacter sp.]|nr:polysaccharide biosynthesis C-terminal domain-containing protein [Oscillibacter sp.]